MSDININEIKLTIEKTVNYDSSMNDTTKEALLKIISVSFMDPLECARLILDQYLIDLNNQYNINISSLKINNGANEYPKRHMDIILLNQFGQSSNASWLKLKYRCMITLYVAEKDVPDEVLVNSIKSVYSLESYNIAFNMTPRLNTPDQPIYKLINTTGHVINEEIFNIDFNMHEKVRLLNLVKEEMVMPSVPETRIKWSDGERVRLLAGRRIYAY